MKPIALKVVSLSVTVALVGCAAFETAASEETTFNQLPKAVRVMVDKDFKEGDLVKANRELKNGEVTYVVTCHDVNGLWMEAEYLEDGTIVRMAYDKRCKH